jgi:hypothetical protein
VLRLDGDPDGARSRFAVLHGVAQALLDRTGVSWQDPEARYRQESLDQAQANLGHEQAGDAYARGLALSFEDALNLAAGRLSPSAGPGRDARGRAGRWRGGGR